MQPLKILLRNIFYHFSPGRSGAIYMERIAQIFTNNLYELQILCNYDAVDILVHCMIDARDYIPAIRNVLDHTQHA